MNSPVWHLATCGSNTVYEQSSTLRLTFLQQTVNQLHCLFSGKETLNLLLGCSVILQWIKFVVLEHPTQLTSVCLLSLCVSGVEAKRQTFSEQCTSIMKS